MILPGMTGYSGSVWISMGGSLWSGIIISLARNNQDDHTAEGSSGEQERHAVSAVPSRVNLYTVYPFRQVYKYWLMIRGLAGYLVHKEVIVHYCHSGGHC